MKSSSFTIKESKEIPYGDQVKSFKQTFKSGAESRKMNAVKYAWIRIRNYFLFLLAYIAPSNRIRVKLNRWKGVNIADGAYIGMFVFIDNAYPEYVYIEEKASINAGSMLITHFNPYEIHKKVLAAKVEPILIKYGAIVAVKSIIMPGVVIGEKAIVSAASVVFEHVEPKTLVRGNPAIRIGKIKL